MNRFLAAAAVAYYLAAWVGTAGMVHARDNARWPQSIAECRENLGFAIVWGAMPFTLLIGIGVTGGAQYGWSLSCDGAK